jgi:hypothetical protein
LRLAALHAQRSKLKGPVNDALLKAIAFNLRLPDLNITAGFSFKYADRIFAQFDDGTFSATVTWLLPAPQGHRAGDERSSFRSAKPGQKQLERFQILDKVRFLRFVELEVK